MKLLGRLLVLLAILTWTLPATADATGFRLRIRAHSTGADPAAVTALGLHAVYVLNSTGSGLTGAALTNTPTSHAQSCTCNLDPNGIDFYVTGSSALLNWDFSAGYEVHFENDQTSSCGNCKFKARNDRGAAVDISQNGDNAVNVTFNDSFFDDTVYYAPGGESPIKINGHGNVTFNRDYHTASTRGQITMGGTGTLTISYNYFGGVAMGTGGLGWGGFHAETIHPQAGTTLVDHTLIDYTATAAAETSGNTGFFNAQTVNSGGSVTFALTNSILKGTNAPSTIPNCHALDRRRLPGRSAVPGFHRRPDLRDPGGERDRPHNRSRQGAGGPHDQQYRLGAWDHRLCRPHHLQRIQHHHPLLRQLQFRHRSVAGLVASLGATETG
jgi:hypothetical protein